MIAREPVSFAVTSSGSTACQPTQPLRELLQGYDRAMRAAAAAPWFVPVAASRLRICRFRLWRPTFLLHFFVVQHIARHTRELERAYRRRAAITGDRDLVRTEQQLLEDFRESLPPVPSRRLLLILAFIAILALTRIFGLLWSNPASSFDTRENRLLQNIEDSVLSLNVHSNAFDAIATTPWKATVALLSIALLSAYLTFRPVWAPFRLKRLLMSLAADDNLSVKAGVMSDAATRSDGLYKLETSVLAEARARERQEFPYDLMVSGLIVVLWAGLAVYETATGHYLLNAIVLGLALLRLAWIVRAGIARGRIVHPKGRLQRA